MSAYDCGRGDDACVRDCALTDAVEVRLSDGGTTKRECVAALGQWSVTKGDKRGRWSVTHTVSGLNTGPQMTQLEAMLVCRALYDAIPESTHDELAAYKEAIAKCHPKKYWKQIEWAFPGKEQV
jgi:hypothetical protein